MDIHLCGHKWINKVAQTRKGKDYHRQTISLAIFSEVVFEAPDNTTAGISSAGVVSALSKGTIYKSQLGKMSETFSQY